TERHPLELVRGPAQRLVFERSFTARREDDREPPAHQPRRTARLLGRPRHGWMIHDVEAPWAERATRADDVPAARALRRSFLSPPRGRARVRLGTRRGLADSRRRTETVRGGKGDAMKSSMTDLKTRIDHE